MANRHVTAKTSSQELRQSAKSPTFEDDYLTLITEGAVCADWLLQLCQMARDVELQAQQRALYGQVALPDGKTPKALAELRVCLEEAALYARRCVRAQEELEEAVTAAASSQRRCPEVAA